MFPSFSKSQLSSIPIFSELSQTLKEKFYVPVDCLLSPQLLKDSVEAFFDFLKEPKDIKNHIDFSISPKHRRADVGYKHRYANDHMYNDDKEFFHFHPAIFERYEDFLKDHPIVLDFMEKAYSVWKQVYDIVYEILEAFESKFSGVCAKVFDTETPHIMLRFLKYEWQQSGKYLAKPHYDAGSFTLAVAESAPGLRIGSCPENLTPVCHEEGKAIFMLSSNFRKVIDSDEFSPGWHDVIQMDETFIDRPYARWAIVAFIEAHGVEALPRTETHKWHTPD